MSNETVEAIERSIKQEKQVFEFGEAIEKLRGNRDFKKVIVEGYFEKEAIRLVHLKADPKMQSADSQKSIVAQIDAIGALSSFFNTSLQLARLAEKNIGQQEETRDEILAEDLNNG